MAQTGYTDISPRTNVYAATGFLLRAQPSIIIEQFAKPRPLPKNKTQTIKFRRYYITGQTGAAGPDTGSYGQALPLTPLTEGVTPVARKLMSKDYSATVQQYGDLLQFTDVIEDTHEDPVINEAVGIHGETIAQMRENLNYNVLVAGTQVLYANGSGRNQVNTVLTLALQRRATTLLNGNNAKRISSAIVSTVNWGTRSVEPAFVALGHTDLETDIRNLAGYKNPYDYGNRTPMPGEVAACEMVRYFLSTNMVPFPDAGGAIAGLSTAVKSTSGTSADVYPIILLGQDAWATVPLQGVASVDVSIIPASKKDKSDPLGQRSYVGFKMWHTALILMQEHIVRLEVAASQ